MVAPSEKTDPWEGQPVVSWAEGLEMRGRVNQTALHLDLLWIREGGTGSRRLFAVSDLNSLGRRVRSDDADPGPGNTPPG